MGAIRGILTVENHARSSDAMTVEELWRAYRAASGVTAPLAGSFAFGDSPELADELARLVRDGPKRATAGLRQAFERDGEPVPRPGDHWVVLDGRGEPVCVIRTTEVETKPLRAVDAAFAWDEGEGDRTLEWWLAAHRAYFARECAGWGVPFHDDLPTVFERFELVWPA
jgi:uncharacterized protein YhfF